MLRSILMGLVAGQRAMTPLAALAGAARRGTLPHDNPAARLMAHPVIAAGGVGLGALEMVGDKQKTAPDRTVFLGLLARTISSGFAGYARAPKHQRVAGAALAIASANASAFGGLALRKWAMRRWGQTATGFAEDAVVFGAANAIVHAGVAKG